MSDSQKPALSFLSNPMQKAFYENLIKGSMKPVPNPLRLQTKVHQIDKDKCRSIKIGDKSLKFPNNGIKTSRYSILSWIPKSLLFQFRRAANVYFLIIAILTAMPFSPKNPVSMTVTFLAVLIFTMFKEGYEDLKRHRQDNKVNQTQVEVLNRVTQQFEEKQSQFIMVGDIIKVKGNDQLPADIIVLHSSNESSVCYVNTMNLDGETNLKERLALDYTQCFDNPQKICKMNCQITCDHPDKSLIKWDCNMEIEGVNRPLSMDQLLLRGCVLKNCDYVYGAVIYTGHETKIMLNSVEAPSKMSNVMITMNRMLYTVFAFQAFICLLFAGIGFYWDYNNSDEHTYLDYDSKLNAWLYITKALTFMVAYSHLIPISLYVAMEVVKLCLAYLIGQDLQMYYEPNDVPAVCRVSDLIEELGQVEFIFSDKTGTLTSNCMELQKFWQNGTEYGGGASIEGYALGSDSSIDEILEDVNHPRNFEISRFVEILSLCHSAFVAEVDGQMQFMSPSPDEIALLDASAKLGLCYIGRGDQRYYTKYKNNEPKEWKLLAEIPFNSDRKRMSVVIQDPQTGNLLLFTKGADNIMKGLLNQDNCDLDEIQNQIDKFAREGLRTLVLAYRNLDQEYFEEWYSRWQEANLLAGDEKVDQLTQIGSEIETDLQFSGISAIEDKLQEGVPETIELLIRANIRLWVLTGDKQETAIEIGKSCNLIQEDTQLEILSSNSFEQLREKVYSLVRQFDLQEFTIDQVKHRQQTCKITLVIDGMSLQWALSADDDFKRNFFKLGLISKSCICCRVSPSQKSEVVKLTQQFGDWITLSVGDGANDVSMIQQAHIGVGIAGKEGTQAIQASDFSIGQFKYLQRLLLVHGRWSYRRISWFICYYFYKNITVVFTELWFSTMNGFSGQIYFLEWLPNLFNALWTSWPCMFIFVFEQDFSDTISLEFPIAYGAGQRQRYFGFAKFWSWALLAIFHGSIAFWVPMLSFQVTPDNQGYDTGMWFISTISFSIVVHTITLKLFLESGHWMAINFVVGLVALCIYYLSIILLNTSFVSGIIQKEMVWLVFHLFSYSKVWITIVLTPFVALIPDFIIVSWRDSFYPSPIERIKKYFGKL